mgnify:CR=1 FL=1
MLKNLNYEQIENLIEEEVKEHSEEQMTIKGYNCYFINLPPYFNYSVLVYKNGHYITEDFELHHSNKNGNKEELKKLYIESLTQKLFTPEEIDTPIMTHQEEESKHDFVVNYYKNQYDNISLFYIGEKQKEELERKINEEGYKYGVRILASSFKTEEERNDVINVYKTFLTRQKEYKKKDGLNYFREHIRKELFNHEYGYTMDATDALNALGLEYATLTKREKAVLKAECDYVLSHTCY